jgi:shikimate dehydrogenase
MMPIPTAAVLGFPVKQSLSPPMHNFWLEKAGIAGMYLPLEIKPDDLKGVLYAMPRTGFVGCNLTIPHKEAAMEMLDDISEIAKAIGAVNTVKFREDHSTFGTNTDGEGFMNNLRYHHPDLTPFKQCALVLGAGGASRAVIYALQAEGFEQILICNRNMARAEEVANHFGKPCDVVPWEEAETAMKQATLLVNTTSLGMTGEDPLPFHLTQLSPEALVTDIVYKPLMTGMLKEAKERGNPVVTGIGMLAHQGVPGFELWFGHRPQVDDDLLALLEASL